MPPYVPPDTIRYGDERIDTVDVPGAFAGTLDTQLRQVISVHDVNRSWNIGIGGEWLNPLVGIAGDIANYDFEIFYGTGSSRIKTIRTLPQPVAVAQIINVIDLAGNLPGEHIEISARMRYIAAAGAARTLQFRLAVICAPVTAFRP